MPLINKRNESPIEEQFTTDEQDRTPGALNLLASGFRNQYTFQAFERAKNAWITEGDDGGTPFDYSADNPLVKANEDIADYLVDASTEEEVLRIIEQRDRSLADKQTLTDGGWGGVAAGIATGLVDPTILIPGVAGFKTFKAGLNGLRAISAGQRAVAYAQAIDVAKDVGLGAALSTSIGVTAFAAQSAWDPALEMEGIEDVAILSAMFGAAPLGSKKGQNARAAKGLAEAPETMAVPKGIEPDALTRQIVDPDDPNKPFRLKRQNGKVDKGVAEISIGVGRLYDTMVQTAEGSESRAAQDFVFGLGQSTYHTDATPGTGRLSVHSLFRGLPRADFDRAMSEHTTLYRNYVAQAIDKPDVSGRRLVGSIQHQLNMTKIRKDDLMERLRGGEVVPPAQIKAITDRGQDLSRAQQLAMLGTPASGPLRPGEFNEAVKLLAVHGFDSDLDIRGHRLRDIPQVREAVGSFKRYIDDGQKRLRDVTDRLNETDALEDALKDYDLKVSKKAARILDRERGLGDDLDVRAKELAGQQAGAGKATVELERLRRQIAKERLDRTLEESGESIVSRLYDRTAIRTYRSDFEKRLVGHFRESFGANLDEVELENIARQAVDKILTGQRGGLGIEQGGVFRIHGRTLAVPDRILDGSDGSGISFLRNDAQQIMGHTYNTVVRDAILLEELGTLDGAVVKTRVRDDYRVLREQDPDDPVRNLKLAKQEARDIENIDFAVGAYRRTLDFPEDHDTPIGMTKSVMRALRSVTTGTLGSAFGLSSLADIPRGAAHFGWMKAYSAITTKFLGEVEAGKYKSAAAMGDALGLVNEYGSSNRMFEIFSQGGGFDPSSKLESGSRRLAETMVRFSGLNWWNQKQKSHYMALTIGEFADDLRTGGKQELFDFVKFSKRDIDLFKAEWKANGNITGSDLIPDITKWSRSAQERFTAGVVANVENIILTPSATGLPKVLQTSEAARFMAQFQNFTLAIMPQGTLRVASEGGTGAFMLHSMGVGLAISSLKEASRPNAFEDVTTSQMVWNAMDQGGFLGAIGTGVNYMDSLGLIDIKSQRYRNVPIAGLIGGPALGTAQNIVDAVGGYSSYVFPGGATEPTDAQRRAARRVIPFVNAIQARALARALETAGIVEPEKQKGGFLSRGQR